MKRAGKLLVIGLFSLLLSGCMFTTPETSLYRLPKLAGEYESLESQIDALLTNGAEYAAPTSGSNLQSVQTSMVTAAKRRWPSSAARATKSR